MLKNVIIFVLLAVPGYLLVKGKILTTKESGVISKVLTWVGLPFMILTSVLKVEFTGSFALELLAVSLIGVAITFLTLFLATLLSKGEKDEKKNGMMRFGMIFANNGFFNVSNSYLSQSVLFLNSVPSSAT